MKRSLKWIIGLFVAIGFAAIFTVSDISNSTPSFVRDLNGQIARPIQYSLQWPSHLYKWHSMNLAADYETVVNRMRQDWPEPEWTWSKSIPVVRGEPGWTVQRGADEITVLPPTDPLSQTTEVFFESKPGWLETKWVELQWKLGLLQKPTVGAG